MPPSTASASSKPAFRWALAPATVTVGIIDDGVDPSHPVFAGRFDNAGSVDHVDGSVPHVVPSSAHGTAVAGVVAESSAAALIQSHRVSFSGDGPWNQFIRALEAQVNVDVSNNSWGFVGAFADNPLSSWMRPYLAALETAATDGRGGLGTVTVFAAGNSRAAGDNVNYHGMQNSEFVIAVGAVDSSGRPASFSTPGAAVLVSAPGVNVRAPDRPGAPGYGPGDTANVSGTSFAAPFVAAVAAEMLAVNPDLGVRDVMEILAYSAVTTDAASPGWQTNGATTWNGGGLTFHGRTGYGVVDEHIAVRLAETWTGQKTMANRAELTVAAILPAPVPIPDGTGSAVAAFDVAGAIEVERVKVAVDIDHTWRGDLTVTLHSPDGTESVLVDRPGRNPDSGGFGSSADDVVFELSSVAHLGESSAGRWELVVADAVAGDSGTLRSARLEIVGAAADEDDVFVFTDEFASLAGADRAVIEATAGRDVMNLSAVRSAVAVDLSAGTAAIAGRALAFEARGSIREVRGGDGGDTLTGAAADETIGGGRGDDLIRGGAGNDALSGDFGNDTLSGGDGVDTAFFGGALAGFAIAVVDALTLTVEGTVRATLAFGIDTITEIEWLSFTDRVVSTADYLPAPEPEPAPPPPPDIPNLACWYDGARAIAARLDAWAAAGGTAAPFSGDAALFPVEALLLPGEAPRAVGSAALAFPSPAGPPVPADGDPPGALERGPVFPGESDVPTALSLDDLSLLA